MLPRAQLLQPCRVRCALGIILLTTLAQIPSIRSSPAPLNKFGIGSYDDTPESAPVTTQLEAVADLVGQRGWVTLYLCEWKNAHASCMNKSTTQIDAGSRAKLLQAYARNLSVVVRLGNPYVVRDHCDVGEDGLPNRSSYLELAQAYGRVVASLPLPPSSARELYVTIGNEFNACNEWRCSIGASVQSNMSLSQMAHEVAGFYRDTAAAVAPARVSSNGRIRYAHAAIASWNMASCACGSAAPQGPGRSGLVFLSDVMRSVPHLYRSEIVDWLSSHSYPYSQFPWGSSKAQRGLTYYRNETQVCGNAALPVIVTETGWNLEHASAANRSAWTVLAFREIWIPDPQVVGVTPFLLSGPFWEPRGWPWCHFGAARRAGAGEPRDGNTMLKYRPTLVFSAVRKLRCQLLPSADCGS